MCVLSEIDRQILKIMNKHNKMIHASEIMKQCKMSFFTLLQNFTYSFKLFFLINQGHNSFHNVSLTLMVSDLSIGSHLKQPLCITPPQQILNQ